MTIDNINFSSFNSMGGSHIINKKSGKYHVMGVDNVGAENGDPISTIVNGIEIDWDGAILPNANITTGGSVTINTTGQLLNLINEMQKEIYTLAAAVIAIGNK